MSDVLGEMKRYYAERAPEYDDWWFRRGRYDLGEEGNARWAAEVAEVEAALAALRPFGDVLELAAGTGLWTRHLAQGATRVLALDANTETLALNRARTDGPVEYRIADLFAWEPEERFDLCCFGFWLSHVPEARFDDFWARVGRALRPGARFFLVDSAGGDPAHLWQNEREHEVRRLADGREFRIVKRRWSAETLASRLAPLGWATELRTSAGGSFVYGTGRMAA
jgi:SAM-dependent methyltransferase